MSLAVSMAWPALRRAAASEAEVALPPRLPLNVWLEPRPQDLPGLRCFAGKDAFGAEETEGDNVEFANAIPRAREGRFRT